MADLLVTFTTTHSDATHIMVVEDDASLAQWISDFLIDSGYVVTVANRGDEAVEMIRTDEPALVILDVNLPSKDGFEVCHEVRSFYHKPVLMLTARGEESDEVSGIEAGANDYLIKPVRPRALLARVQSLLSRGETVPSSKNSRIFGELEINAESRSVLMAGQAVELSTHEFDLCWLLSENANIVMSRDDMVGAMRGIEYDGFNRSVDILVSRLRKKLGDTSQPPQKIKTVWGKGYMFVADAW